ncbi:hypothetical protein Hanom_Chr00s005611g01729511 [Helianthus anomalus]
MVKISLYTYHYCSNSMLEIKFTSLNLREFVNKENLHVCKFVIYTGFGCIFIPFVHLSSFNHVNSKGRQKQTFSNISTKKSYFYVSFDIIYMLHFAHINRMLLCFRTCGLINAMDLRYALRG